MSQQFPDSTIEANKRFIKDHYKSKEVFKSGLTFKLWIKLKIEERAEREEAEKKNKDNLKNIETKNKIRERKKQKQQEEENEQKRISNISKMAQTEHKISNKKSDDINFKKNLEYDIKYWNNENNDTKEDEKSDQEK